MTALMPNYAPAPVRFVSGKGARLTDAEGREYLDFLCGIAVTSLGHAHPAVTAALREQATTLLHVSNLFANGINEEVAERLDALIGDGRPLGGKVFFCNSGAEANECALKLARRYSGPGRHGVVCAYGSFHGRTLAALAATGQPGKHEPFAPMPEGFRHVAFGDLEALSIAADPRHVGAVLLEVIEGEGGVIPMPPGFLTAVRRLCDERGILLMLDEVQSGLGRTGRWFACHHENVTPDVLTIAKSLANGVPAGACWARAEVAAAFQPGDHGSTFGGQPLAMAAARATLDTLVAIDAPECARSLSEQLSRAVGELPGVEYVRGMGALLGAVLHEGLDAAAIVRDCLEHGLVLNTTVPGVIRILPPYIASDEDCEEAVAILDAALRRELIAKGMDVPV